MTQKTYISVISSFDFTADGTLTASENAEEHLGNRVRKSGAEIIGFSAVPATEDKPAGWFALIAEPFNDWDEEHDHAELPILHRPI